MPLLPFPRFEQGFAFLKDDCNKLFVYYVGPNSPAAEAGFKIGMTVTKFSGKDAEIAIEKALRQIIKYMGYSF